MQSMLVRRLKIISTTGRNWSDQIKSGAAQAGNRARHRVDHYFTKRSAEPVVC